MTTPQDLDHLVQADRVHRTVYTDQGLFDLEMEHIFEKIWVYCGHESQVPKPGDYHTLQIGRQPMVMVCSTTAVRIAACRFAATKVAIRERRLSVLTTPGASI